MDGSGLFVSFFFSLVGMAVFKYGREQRLAAPTVIGVALMVYPYFVGDTRAVAGVGFGLLAALYLGMRLG